MRAMVLEQPGRPLRLTELPRPVPDAGQLLLAVEACGVCRTDLHLLDGELPDPVLPLVPGHEIVARIAGLGPDAQGDWREEWTPGQPDLLPRAVEAVVTRRGEPPVTLRFLVGPGPAERPLIEGAPDV